MACALGPAILGSWFPVLAAGPKDLEWEGETLTGIRALGALTGLLAGREDRIGSPLGPGGAELMFTFNVVRNVP